MITPVIFLFWTCLLSFKAIEEIDGLENGLARTPPMGWLAWQRYRCITDCNTYPDDCVNEDLFKRTADLLVSEGYAKLGYEYVIVDDCWLAENRSADGKLQADPIRFPSGIKSLADYVHQKGLKFGLNEDVGTKTCAGYPGVFENEELDVKTFAEWGIDYIKLGGCYSNVRELAKGYVKFGTYLKKSKKAMVYSCSWPAFQEAQGLHVDYDLVAKHCNLWRNYSDINDSWESMIQIADYFAEKQELWAKYAGPGHWNDPDMLIIGNFGLSYDQSKTQMAIWAVLAAPLLMSNNLKAIQLEFKKILQNEEIIKVNQDELGIQGTRVFQENGIDVWVRPINPVKNGYHSYAVAFVSRHVGGAPYLHSITLDNLGLTNPSGYKIVNLFDQENVPYCTFGPKSIIKVLVNPTGVVFLRINAIDPIIQIQETNSIKLREKTIKINSIKLREENIETNSDTLQVSYSSIQEQRWTPNADIINQLVVQSTVFK
ncbi:Hypothetical protein CINCED_3A014137 [Cinara cedri]|uniref:Alpha-galactosidase n=1 Tax=Cinara cedri TaxID=506608 RepID=A0A5E4N2A8_9HEMI|nr:Hypothetical protein CINCED_3A014137 [Cinara cedri]